MFALHSEEVLRLPREPANAEEHRVLAVVGRLALACAEGEAAVAAFPPMSAGELRTCTRHIRPRPSITTCSSAHIAAMSPAVFTPCHSSRLWARTLKNGSSPRLSSVVPGSPLTGAGGLAGGT